ncbi:hypothetical protein MNBD_CHLOROFLEXI01-3616 [hydrothermal vent metagenome]|uniref:Uncharacterized protein n=1 Tax=hydrothermal vent metagenome TaxID=652676 RepID=A0A3B0UU13_9ZZZZ
MTVFGLLKRAEPNKTVKLVISSRFWREIPLKTVIFDDNLRGTLVLLLYF